MKGTTTSEKEEFSKLISIEECPLCNRKLDKGFIIATWEIRWDTEKRKPIALYFMMGPLIRGHSAPALRCKSCEIVIFDYESYLSDLTPKSFLKKCMGCGKEIPIAELQCQYCGAKQN